MVLSVLTSKTPPQPTQHLSLPWEGLVTYQLTILRSFLIQPPAKEDLTSRTPLAACYQWPTLHHIEVSQESGNRAIFLVVSCLNPENLSTSLLPHHGILQTVRTSQGYISSFGQGLGHSSSNSAAHYSSYLNQGTKTVATGIQNGSSAPAVAKQLSAMIGGQIPISTTSNGTLPYQSRHQFSPGKNTPQVSSTQALPNRPESPSVSMLGTHQRLKSTAGYSQSSQALPTSSLLNPITTPSTVQLGPKLTMTSLGMVPRNSDTPKHKASGTRQPPQESPAHRTQNHLGHLAGSFAGAPLSNPLMMTYGSVGQPSVLQNGVLGLRPRRLSSGGHKAN